MNKFFLYFFLLILLSNCSFVKKDVVEQNNEGKDIFEKIEPIQKELNPKLNIQLSKLTKEKPFLNNNSNNSGNINFETNFQKTSSYKFKVIKKYKHNQPELIFTDDKKIIFFDGKGSVFKINEDLKEVWKVNNYNKHIYIYQSEFRYKFRILEKRERIFFPHLNSGFQHTHPG